MIVVGVFFCVVRLLLAVKSFILVVDDDDDVVVVVVVVFIEFSLELLDIMLLEAVSTVATTGISFICSAVGVGVGGEFPNEFSASGIPVKERGSRLDEGIEVIRKLWTGEVITHIGRHFKISNLQMLPTPIRSGGPRIWCGGRSTAALERAGRRLDGWISYVVTPEMYRDSLNAISKHYVAAHRQLDEFGSAHLLFLRLDSDWESAFKTASKLLSERYAMDFSGPTKKYVALGQAADIAEQLSAFHSVGVRHIELDFIGSVEEKESQLLSFAEDVLPLINFE